MNFLLTTIDPISLGLNWDWLSEITVGSVFLRLILALIIGTILGYERTLKHQNAGLRTYSLVCLGACVAMMTNQYIFQFVGSGDAARIGAQVVSGIGFLGAGTILVTSRNQIRGLTTAAGLWACGTLGLAIGIGFYTLALAATLIIVVILVLLPKLEPKITRGTQILAIHIELETRKNLRDIITILRNEGYHIDSIERNPAYSESGLSVYEITSRNKNIKDHSDTVTNLSKLEYVNFVEATR